MGKDARTTGVAARTNGRHGHLDMNTRSERPVRRPGHGCVHPPGRCCPASAPTNEPSTSRQRRGLRPTRAPPFRSAALADSRDARAVPRTSVAERPPQPRRPGPGVSASGSEAAARVGRPGRCDVSPSCRPGAFERRRRVRARVPDGPRPGFRPRLTAHRLGIRGSDVPRPGRPFALGRPYTRARRSDVPRPVVAPMRRGPARTQVRATAARPAAHLAYPDAILVPATEGLTERLPVVPPRPSTAPAGDPATTRVPQVPSPSRRRRPEVPRRIPPAAGSRTPPATEVDPAGRRRPHPAGLGRPPRAAAPSCSAPSTQRRATFSSVYLGGLAAPKRTLRDILETTARRTRAPRPSTTAVRCSTTPRCCVRSTPSASLSARAASAPATGSASACRRAPPTCTSRSSRRCRSVPPTCPSTPTTPTSAPTWCSARRGSAP